MKTAPELKTEERRQEKSLAKNKRSLMIPNVFCPKAVNAFEALLRLKIAI